MKKYLHFLVIIIAMLFSACEKDDNNQTENLSVTGTWNIISQRHEKYNGSTKISDETTTDIGKVTFNSNGTFSFTNLSGDVLATGDYQYSKTNKTLNIKISTEPDYIPGVILEHSSSKLVFRLEIILDPPENGANKDIVTTTVTK